MSKLRQITKEHENKVKFHALELRKHLIQLGYTKPTPGVARVISIWEHSDGEIKVETSDYESFNIKVICQDIVNQSIRCEKLPKWHLKRWMKSFIQSVFAKLSGK